MTDDKKEKKILKLRSKIRNIDQVKNPFNLLFSGWIFSLVKLARATTILPEYLPPTVSSHTVEKAGNRYKKLFDSYESKGKELGLTAVFFQYKVFYITFFLQLYNSVYNLYTPFVVEKITAFMALQLDDNIPKEDKDWNYIIPWLISWIVLACIYTFTSSQINGYNYFAGSKIRAGFQSLIYEKLLRLPASVNNDECAGSLVNLIMNDTFQFIWSCTAVHYAWSVPASFGAGWGLLIYSAGIYAALAYLLGLCVLVPIIAFFSSIMLRHWQIKMGKSDVRVNKISETIQNMKITKLMAWEEYDAQVIGELRADEVNILKKFIGSRWTIIFNINAVQIICTLICLATYIKTEKNWNVANIVRISLLCSAICFPLIQGSLMLVFLLQTKGSLKRIIAFLKLPELPKYVETTADSSSETAINVHIERLSYPTSTLKEVMDMNKKKPKKSKKSKTEPPTDQVVVTQEMMEQSAPIDQPTVEGSEAEPSTIINSNAETPAPCSDNPTQTTEECNEENIDVINVDTEGGDEFSLQNIDLTIKRGETVAIVGQVGSGKSSLFQAMLNELQPVEGTTNTISISGSLAYFQQNGSVFNETVRENITFGKEFSEKWYDEVITKCCLKPDLAVFAAGDMTEIGERGSSTSGGQKARVDLARCVYSKSDIYLLDDPLSAVDAHISKALMQHIILELLHDKTVILATHQLQVLPSVDRVILMDKGTVQAQGTYEEVKHLISNYEFKKAEDEEPEPNEEAKPSSESTEETNTSADAATIEREEQNEGAVRLKTYYNYFKYSNIPFIGTTILLFQGFAAGLQSFGSWWVNTMAQEGDSSRRVLAGYSGAVLFSLFCIGVSLVALYFLNIRVSTNLHAGMLKKILHAPSGWFTGQPLGRIQNRFASDIQNIDFNYAFSLESIINQLCTLVVSIVMICLPTGWLVIACFLCMLFAWMFLQLYRPIARDLKRCDNINKSPVLSHTAQTLSGITTIRSLDQVQNFRSRFNERCNRNTTSTWLINAASVWQSVYTNLAGVLLQIILYVVGCCLSYYDHSKDVGTLATALQTVSQLTWTLVYISQSFANLEQSANSLERVEYYTNVIPQEPDYVLETDPEPAAWPVKGSISFKDVSARYRDDLPLVIQHLNLEIEGGQRIGIVGRSGAGKSTMTNLILRILNYCEGSITIDDIDITTIGIHTLRGAIAVIPQDPLLSSGTLRSVLDPGHKYEDIAVWEALKTTELDIYFKELQGLETPIAPGGSNLSAGQKQLLCLARALLKKSKIICIDEATSSVSFDQDALIQQKIRSGFSKSTILAVAHRINTIIDFDRIIVMDKGQVSEFGTPFELYNSHGLFRSLCNSADIKPIGVE